MPASWASTRPTSSRRMCDSASKRGRGDGVRRDSERVLRRRATFSAHMGMKRGQGISTAALAPSVASMDRSGGGRGSNRLEKLASLHGAARCPTRNSPRRRRTCWGFEHPATLDDPRRCRRTVRCPERILACAAREAAPARPADLPDSNSHREWQFPGYPGNSRPLLLPGNWPTRGRSANFDSDCDSEGYMCTGSSARASGLRKLQFALCLSDTRRTSALRNTNASRPRTRSRARRPGAAPRALALVLALRRVQVLLAWPWSWASRRPRSLSAWR